MVTLAKIIEGLEMVDDVTDCYYNQSRDEKAYKTCIKGVLFFVDENHHKQGIGKQLFNKVESLNDKGFCSYLNRIFIIFNICEVICILQDSDDFYKIIPAKSGDNLKNIPAKSGNNY